MKQNTVYLCLLIFSLFSCEQSTESVELKSINGSMTEILTELSAMEDHEARKQLAEALWLGINDSAKVPYTYLDTAIFLYKGDAKKVSFNGDFNSWGGNKSIQNKAKRIDSTDLWYLVKQFPADARLDYKITLNDQQWILDPANAFQQWSGFGPNSELRMPLWEEETVNQITSNTLQATVDSFTIESTNLNYTVSFKVYLPYNYPQLANLPVLYVTDGHEYSDPKLGNLNTIADNLITEGKVAPIIIVYVDPRNPTNLNENRRQQEYVLNAVYLEFVATELIPHIDNNYKSDKNSRAILGTSLGGLNASYFGLSKPELFSHVLIQSPAYWYKPEIFTLATQNKHNHQKIFMSAGTFNDGLDRARQMEDIYIANGLSPQFLEVNEGHSWGAWNHQLDDILLFSFPAE